MKQKILLTGASGTVGKAVFDQLISLNKYDITIFIRPSWKNRRLFKKYRSIINVVYGDISQFQDVNKITEHFDAVIHLAAVIPPLADEKPELARLVNTNGTAHLIKVLEQTSPHAFLMHSSSIAIYGDRIRDPYIRVGDLLNPNAEDIYSITKIDAENVIKNSRLDWTIFRLTAIMGVNNHKISKLMFHMPLDTQLEIATPGDTGRAFVHGLEKRAQLVKRIFNLGGGAKCRILYFDLLQKSFELVGLGPLDFHPKSFAEKNFHCGNFMDGDVLDSIVHFRSETLDDYFLMTKKNLKPMQKQLTWLGKRIIKKYLQRQSEPLRAIRQNDQEKIVRFFNK